MAVQAILLGGVVLRAAPGEALGCCSVKGCGISGFAVLASCKRSRHANTDPVM